MPMNGTFAPEAAVPQILMLQFAPRSHHHGFPSCNNIIGNTARRRRSNALRSVYSSLVVATFSLISRCTDRAHDAL
jgi:hypothetical protein